MSVHNHPPYRPICNERLVDDQLRGTCLNDDGTPRAPRTALDLSPEQMEKLVGVIRVHRSQLQNFEGDWLCSCGGFLAASAHVDRVAASWGEHLGTILRRRLIAPWLAEAVSS